MSSNIDIDGEHTANHNDKLSALSLPSSRIVAPYQLLPTDIRNKIFDQLHIVDRFKLIHFRIEIVDMFNPYTDEVNMFNLYTDEVNTTDTYTDRVTIYNLYDDKVILKSDSDMDLILLMYLCEMRNTHNSRQLSTKIYHEIEYRENSNPDIDIIADKFLYRNDMDLLTLAHIYAVLNYISEEYYLGNIHIVDIRLLTVFMREVSRRLSKMPRDSFRDHIAVYDIIYNISITLIAINYNQPPSIYTSIVDILNTYFDKATTDLFGADIFEIVYNALVNGIVPYYGMDEDDNSELCVELISNVINPLLLNKTVNW